MANTPFTDSELNLYCVVWGFFWFPKSADTVSRQLCTARAHRDVPWTEGTMPQSTGDIATGTTMSGGLILPSPWDCFKAGIILDVKWVEVGWMCHLLCTGTQQQLQWDFHWG